jgi:formylglycine-generating enzyme required for sulfatase activity/Leucine-rich repeat (LRR) protein
VTFPSGLTNLTTLNVAGNQLTNLTLPCDLTALDAVDVHINQIANFSLPGDLTSLSHFDIDENQLNSFSVPASLTNLVFLDLSFNSLTNLSLPEDFTNLAALDLDFNQFTALELPSNLTGLKELHLRSNQLTNFVLPTGMIALAYFDIGENQLRNITLPAGLGGLATIRISGNTNLTSLTLPAGMTNLTQIFLRSNQLTNFTLSPDLNRLATIDILGNQLTSLTLPSGLTNLTELALSGNLLTNLTLPPDMTQLSWLVLNGNPLTTLVLSEPLASTSLSNTVASLRSEGVSVFTYPLEIQVIRPRQLLGAFQFAITGPPGVYKVMDAADLTVWSEFDVVTNSVGTVVFNDAGVQFTGQKFYKALRQDPPAKMIFIRPCTFNMGSPDNEVGRSPDEGPQTLVTLNRGFWMSQFLVTQQDYLDVIGSNPSGFPGDLNRPVESVTWLDATNYCVQLTKRELAAGRIPPRSHYRLPTEAEWECAARAGTATRFNYGDDPNAATLANYAWYGAQGGATTHPVGLKQPNAWGLYDMEGNVWEWCQDWYGPYSGGSQTDPQGPASSATGLKVIRGGAWESFDSDCRSARRMTKAVSPFISDFIIGFRVVLTIDP